MPRSLAAVFCAVIVLAGCSLQQQQPVPVSAATPQVQQFPSIGQWLDLHHAVEHLSYEQAVERLVEVDKPDSIGQMFYYGLLNQRLGSYAAWIHARDAFQKIQENDTLGFQQRQLAGILREFNQSRINNHLRHTELKKQHSEIQLKLAESEQEKQLLEEKIQALTDLEAVISTRREE